MKINMQDKVKSTLMKYPNTKDCDPYLLYYIWESELKDINLAYSLNIDSNAEGGRLRGVPEDASAAFLLMPNILNDFDSGDMAHYDGMEYAVYDGGQWKIAFLFAENV